MLGGTSVLSAGAVVPLMLGDQRLSGFAVVRVDERSGGDGVSSSVHSPSRAPPLRPSTVRSRRGPGREPRASAYLYACLSQSIEYCLSIEGQVPPY